MNFLFFDFTSFFPQPPSPDRSSQGEKNALSFGYSPIFAISTHAKTRISLFRLKQHARYYTDRILTGELNHFAYNKYNRKYCKILAGEGEREAVVDTADNFGNELGGKQTTAVSDSSCLCESPFVQPEKRGKGEMRSTIL